MPEPHNTLLLRLEGPLQSWGIQGKLVYRPTEQEPTKSGILGLIACAMGLPRTERTKLKALSGLKVGVRVDRQGAILRDYHTVGAKVGNMSAAGKVKITQSTGEVETLLSVRTYLQDAVFTVALLGDPKLIQECADAFHNPKWQIFLGRKSCPPSAPICERTTTAADLMEALKSAPWRGRWANERPPERLRCLIETDANDPKAIERYDHPEYFWRDEDHQFSRHWPRLVREEWIQLEEIATEKGAWGGPDSQKRGYSISNLIWNDDKKDENGNYTAIRKQALKFHGEYCVLTGLPAEEVHHKRYPDDIFHDTDRNSDLVKQHVRDDLIPLSRLAHEAITMLEYRHNMGKQRIDPLDPFWKPQVLEVINHILTQRVHRPKRSGVRRK